MDLVTFAVEQKMSFIVLVSFVLVGFLRFWAEQKKKSFYFTILSKNSCCLNLLKLSIPKICLLVFFLTRIPDPKIPPTFTIVTVPQLY